MINNEVLISQFIDTRALVSWIAANADDVSFVSVNGTMVHPSIYPGVLNRQVRIKMTSSENKSITVQDFLSGEDLRAVGPIEVLELRKPLLKWSKVPSAEFYRIYHTPFGESESLIYNKRASEDAIFSVNCPVELVEGWHLFRVEAVDNFGNESTREIWAYRQFRLPEPVNNLTVVEGSALGLFDITIS